MQMALASEVSGVSPATLYSVAASGGLKLFKLAGRTLVDTASLKALIASRQAWTPSNRGAAARAKRSEVARMSLR
ncbi:helix-turn-helix domain-containing protein [Methylobacterium soli]|uniref:Helix-turn-helix domain-containing protein n=1 Tax=Methylobacterium soli TaxID=553447 RepID=A0A6L3SUF5_9HYPH|nr:helix-turn-helix domain-containing protein [Methylobacterium soli]KAB1075391.1 helix-turn-helix domain-containing protein [Methylobacterium soli]